MAYKNTQDFSRTFYEFTVLLQETRKPFLVLRQQEPKNPRTMAEANGFGPFDEYRPWDQTEGFVFVNANHNGARFLNLHPQHNGLPLLTHFNFPAFIPHPLSILYASWCFILFRDALNSYNIFRSLADPLFIHAILPNPPRPHANNTPAVIAVSMFGQFHVICAIDEGRGRYTFDVYSSATGNWSHAQGPIDLGGRSIIMNTGVSFNQCAYWLTDGLALMPVVIRHDPENHLSTILGGEGALYNIAGPERRGLQLGRVDDHLAVVVLRVDWSAGLYVWGEENHWVPSFTRVIMEGEIDDHDQVVILRFESYEMEVLFCVGPERRLLLWESRRASNEERLRPLGEAENIWENGANQLDIANGVPAIRPFPHGFHLFLW